MPAKDTDSPSVDFNFDTWEQEDAPAPFGVVVGGKRYEAVNPMDVDFRELDDASSSESADEMFRVLFPDDYKTIYDSTLKAGAVMAFMERVQKHYGLDPTAAPATSSAATAQR